MAAPLSLVGPTGDVTVGSTATFTVVDQNALDGFSIGSDIYLADFSLSYDPSLLQYLGTQPSSPNYFVFAPDLSFVFPVRVVSEFVLGSNVATASWIHVALDGITFRIGRPVDSFDTQPPPTSEHHALAGLSETTMGLLQRLDSPVEIRFYSLLRESQGNSELKTFAGRVAELLGEYDRAGGGKIVVRRFESGGIAGTQSAATADGIEPVRVQQGEMDYLGVAVVCGGQKAVIPRISPEWEAALEFDLSRAIARVTGRGWGRLGGGSR